MKKGLYSHPNLKKKTNPSTRRDFMKKAALGTLGLTIVPRSVLGRGFVAPSDKIGIGVIGLGKQISGLTGNFMKEPSAQIMASCDVWSTKREWYNSMLSKKIAKQKDRSDFKGLRSYANYKELLEQSDIDAVIIATPDHWHGIQAVDAMKAGKDVYCEKPLTHTITEGIELVETARREKRILQTGSMQRSWDDFRKACGLIRNGYLGEVKKVLVSVGDPAIDYNMKKEELPKEIDWNAWCGPAPLLDYNHRLAPSRNNVDFWPDWRMFKEVGGGILCDWGAHMFDIAQWALGTDDTGPVEYVPPKDSSSKRGMKMVYESGVEMYHEDFGRGWGVRFIGSEGTLDVSRQFLEADPQKILKVKESDFETHLYKVKENHYQDWLDAIKNRTDPICKPEIGHRSASICNIANIGYWLNRPLKWDPVKEDFIGDPEATALKTRNNRAY